MKESLEKVIKLGFRRNPRKVFDEIESVAAGMIRDGWELIDSVLEDTFDAAHLFFERDINISER